MRVYIINANWGNGGPGGIAADIYNVLKDNGHECKFAYGRGNIPANISSYRIGTKFDVYVHAISARLFDNAGFMSAKATENLINEIKSFDPDIISLHNLLGYTLNIEKFFQFIRDSGIPTFWTLHDCWYITGHCIFGFCDHWTSGCGKCPRKREFPKSLLLDRSRQNLMRKQAIFSDVHMNNLHLIAPSEWIKKVYSKTYLGSYPITVIPNGIDFTVFRPTKSDIRETYGLSNKIILLAVASVWSQRKGGDYLQQIVEKLDDSYRLVMIGRDSEKYKKNSEKIIAFDRTNDRTQLAQWYTAADVFVNPTIGDNFPTVNLEALACGTPVVTFDTGGSSESVGNCGIVVNPGNIENLYSAIIDCVERKIPPELCAAQASYYNKNDRYLDYLKLFQSQLKD